MLSNGVPVSPKCSSATGSVSLFVRVPVSEVHVSAPASQLHVSHSPRAAHAHCRDPRAAPDQCSILSPWRDTHQP